MKAVYALYADGHAAQRAVNALRAVGIPDTDITVITPTPMDDFDFSHIDSKNHLWLVASAGGLVGLLVSLALTVYTARAWPMNVGNMSTVAWWPFLVVMFEVTMFGAIFATVGTLIVTAGLGRRRPVLYDSAVSDGKILVGIENPRDSSMTDVENALLSSPQVTVKTV